MGNYRFRLSEMIPNGWFYKLKDWSSNSSRSNRNQISNSKQKHSQFPTTSTTTKQQQQHTKSKLQATPKTVEAKAEESEFHDLSHSRKSYYFNRDFIHQTDPLIQQIYSFPDTNNNNLPDPPRKSAKKRTTKHRKSTATAAATATARSSTGSALSGGCTQSSPDHAALPCSAYCRRRAQNPMAVENDVIVAIDEKSLALKEEEINGFDSISKLDLPPIITKPAKLNDMAREIKNRAKGSELKEQRTSCNSARRSFSVNSPTTRVRLRVNSPRIGRKGQGNNGGRRNSMSGTGSCQRRSISSESFAIVKSSFDPQKDFRESMVEMIVENNISGSKDLEELLACYLSLNSDEYHDLIVKVFKQIWFDMTEIKQRTK